MALPEKKIKKIKLPGDVSGNKTYEIVPDKLSDGSTNFSATLPTLTEDSTIALASDIPDTMTQAQFDAATGGATPSSTVNPIVDLVYPVGAIYVTTVDTTVAAVQARFSGTTWESIQGRFLLGASDGSSDPTLTSLGYFPGGTTYGHTYTYLTTSGSVTRSITPGTPNYQQSGGEVMHNLVGVEMPAHSHDTTLYYKAATATSSGAPWTLAVDSNGASGSKSYSSSTVGAGVAHNNMPPYYIVYMYKRIA